LLKKSLDYAVEPFYIGVALRSIWSRIRSAYVQFDQAFFKCPEKFHAIVTMTDFDGFVQLCKIRKLNKKVRVKVIKSNNFSCWSFVGQWVRSNLLGEVVYYNEMYL